MCGIWFSLGFAPDRAHIDIVAHRGPDGSGWRECGSVAGPLVLGHRRLSIIDLSDAAAQPMQYADGRYWLSYNGEIYNYLELRAQLSALGHAFHTRCDAEVLLAAYAQWGTAALARFVGMFAFVLWDAGAQTVFAARDRFGIKPLYHFASPGGLALASEIKQLIGLPGFAARLNRARAYDFLSAGIVEHTNETLFAGVGQLRGGECFQLQLGRWRPGDPLPVRRWYPVIKPGTLAIDERSAADRFGALLAEAVHLHMRSDVPVGSCLSGGLDSSSIVCLMARELAADGKGARVNSVSACYDVAAVDERPYMEAVVRHAACRPHWCWPRVEDAFALSERITWHQDEPYGSTSIFAQWSVFEAARRAGIKVMLDGQGADEQLGGYHGGFPYHYCDLLRHGRFAALLRAVIERRRWHGASLLREAASAMLPLLPAGWTGLLLRRRRALIEHDWLGGELLRPHRHRSALETARQTLGLPPIRGIGDLCRLMTQGSNLGMLLHWEDRNSMAHSIEARVPFLDHRLVELSIALGDRHKMVGGDTKRVLRRAMAGVLPETVRNRRDKLGFATPEESWLRGPLRSAVLAGIEQTLGHFPGLLNPTGVRAYAADMLDGRRAVDFALWRIVNFGIWGRLFRVSA